MTATRRNPESHGGFPYDVKKRPIGSMENGVFDYVNVSFLEVNIGKYTITPWILCFFL